VSTKPEQTNKQTNKQTTPLPTPEKIQFRHAYSPRYRVSIAFPGKGRTKQEFKEESDINVIMARYMRTGHLDNVTTRLPQFVDLEGGDFYQAMQIVAESKSLFQELPSHIRTRFENDPGKFLDFVHDPENRSEMAEMGLLRDGADSGTPTPTQAAPTQPAPVPATPGATTTAAQAAAGT